MFQTGCLLNIIGNLHLCEIVTLLFALLSAVAYGIYYFKFKHLIEVTRNIPSPPSWPIVGHGHYFIFKKPHEMLKTMVHLGETYGRTEKCIKIWLGTELNVVTGDVKDVEIILGGVHLLDKAGEYKYLESWLGEGLLVSRGRKWHKRRKIITPAFHFGILAEFTENFEKESRRLVQNLNREYRMQTEAGFSLGEWINLCTLDAVCGKIE